MSWLFRVDIKKALRCPKLGSRIWLIWSSQLIDCLASMSGVPCSIPTTSYKTSMEAHTCKSPALGRQRHKDQKFCPSQLHSDSEASLGTMRPCLKKTKGVRNEKSRNRQKNIYNILA